MTLYGASHNLIFGKVLAGLKYLVVYRWKPIFWKLPYWCSGYRFRAPHRVERAGRDGGRDGGKGNKVKRKTQSAISGLTEIVVNHGLVLLPRRRSDGSKGEEKKGF